MAYIMAFYYGVLFIMPISMQNFVGYILYKEKKLIEKQVKAKVLEEKSTNKTCIEFNSFSFICCVVFSNNV